MPRSVLVAAPPASILVMTWSMWGRSPSLMGKPREETFFIPCIVYHHFLRGVILQSRQPIANHGMSLFGESPNFY
jgi:hypothetical protein